MVKLQVISGKYVYLYFIVPLSKKEIYGEKLQAKAAQGDVSLAFGELSNIKTEGDHLADFSSRAPGDEKQMILSQIL